MDHEPQVHQPVPDDRVRDEGEEIERKQRIEGPSFSRQPGLRYRGVMHDQWCRERQESERKAEEQDDAGPYCRRPPGSRRIGMSKQEERRRYEARASEGEASPGNQVRSAKGG